jgi:hypothetical protein
MRLDARLIAAHVAAMPAFALPLARLRRSALGAWLAVAYALAVLAAGLMPAPAEALPPGIDKIVLCSGATAPGDETPAPLGEFQHCKGCPANPAVAASPAAQATAHVRFATRLTLAPAPQMASPHGFGFGLPRSRAPPLA